MTKREKITVKTWWQVAGHINICNATYREALSYRCRLLIGGNGYNIYVKPLESK